MKKIKINYIFVTNCLLVGLFAIVLSISLLPEASVPIYGGNQLKPIYNGNRQQKQVSLMFNVYENSQVVNSIIDELNSRGLKATFFVGGCWADDNIELLNKMVQCGHEVANHGYFHKDHAKLNYQQNFEEIKLTGTIIKSLCGAQSTLFAPPSGSFNDNTLISADKLGYKVIMWSKDTIDWRDKDLNKIYKRATNNISNGDLVLMHPKQHTLQVLPKILDYYSSIGLKQVTVSQNIM